MPPSTSLESLAGYFFALPHPRFTHDGVENHYHFSICPAAYADPEDDIVQVVKVGNNFTHIGGPMQLRVLPLKKRVDTILRFLFVSFLNGLPTRLNDEIQHAVKDLGGFPRFSKGVSSTASIPNGGCGDGMSRLIRLTLAENRKVAPCSWSTDDAELMEVMSTRLQEFAGSVHGNHPLLNIRLADERDNLAAMITYIAFQNSLIRGIKKHTTDVLRETAVAATWSRQNFDPVPPTPVTLAGRSLVTTVIEEEDEDEYEMVDPPSKRVANAQAKLFNPDPDGDFLDPSTYYNTKAHRVQGACSLAASVNLVLPEGEVQSEAVSIIVPLRRLIITNNDTPQNLTLLLGPRFHSSALAQSLYASTRVKTALVPPIGSSLYSFFYVLDNGAPYRRPGLLSSEERTTCSKVYAILRFMKHRMGTLGRKVDDEEINELMELWGQENKEEIEMEIWKMAVGCLDQGLQTL